MNINKGTQREHEAHIERFRGAIAILGPEAIARNRQTAEAVQAANAIWDETYITEAETEALEQEARTYRAADAVENGDPLPIDLTDKGVKVGDRVEYIPQPDDLTVLDYNDRGTVIATREDYATIEWDDDHDHPAQTVLMSRLEKLVAVALDKDGNVVWTPFDAPEV